MSAEQKEAVSLRYYDCLDLNTIAIRMGKNVNAVRMLINRGLANLEKNGITSDGTRLIPLGLPPQFDLRMVG